MENVTTTAQNTDAPETITPEAFAPLDTPDFRATLAAYQAAAGAHIAACRAGLVITDKDTSNALSDAYTDASAALLNVVEDHLNAVHIAAASLDIAALRAAGIAPKRTHGYIGHASLLYGSNERRITRLLKEAIGQGVDEVTLTLPLPVRKTALSRRVNLTLRASLPQYTGFEVVQTDETRFEECYVAATWEEALAWLAANDHTLHYDRTWAIYGQAENGETVSDLNLLCYAEEPTQETPPMVNKAA